MWPERVKEDLKLETAQNVLWRDLHAFSSNELKMKQKQILKAKAWIMSRT